VAQLAGTWLSIVREQRWIPNPVDDGVSMYCSAFVRHCYRAAGADFLGADISVTNTTPEDIGQAGLLRGHLTTYAAADRRDG
jgi:hypothetical protein